MTLEEIELEKETAKNFVRNQVEEILTNIKSLSDTIDDSSTWQLPLKRIEDNLVAIKKMKDTLDELEYAVPEEDSYGSDRFIIGY